MNQVVDIVDRSDELDKRIAGSDTITHLTVASKRNRTMIRLLWLTVTLDIFLSVALGVVGYENFKLAQQANSLQVRIQQTCLAGNDARRGQITLWKYLLDFPPNAPRTHVEQQQIDSLRVYINKLFAPRNCSVT
jgi:hypothetical protein